MTSLLIGLVFVAIIVFAVARARIGDAKADLRIIPNSLEPQFGETLTGQVNITAARQLLAQRVQLYLLAKAADGKLGGKSTRFVEAYRQPALLAENTRFETGEKREFVFSFVVPTADLAGADEQSLKKHYSAKHAIQWQLAAEIVVDGVNIEQQLPIKIKGEALLNLK